MDARKGVTEGMLVYTRDGETLGKIVSVDDTGLFVEKGFFHKEYGFGFDDVEDVRDGSVHLRLDKNAVTPGHSSRSAAETLDSALEAAEERAGTTTELPIDEGEGLVSTGGRAVTGDVRVVHRERSSSQQPVRRADQDDPNKRG
jgi:hypothetical protein